MHINCKHPYLIENKRAAGKYAWVCRCAAFSSAGLGMAAIRRLEMGGTRNGTFPRACEDRDASWNIHTRAFETDQLTSAAGSFALGVSQSAAVL